MIPFDPSAVFFSFLLLYVVGGACALLLYVVGGACALLLSVWWLRLVFSPRARQNFAKHRLGKSVLMACCLLGAVLPVYELFRLNQLSTQIKAEIAQEEAERTPTLAQDKVLAGIAMPAGTKLTLLFHNAVGKQWVKPEYFEQAEFPQPITWQGVSIKQLSRRLQIHQDNNPESFRTTRVTWGRGVDTELAAPHTIADFYCQDTVSWHYYPNGDETSWDYHDDAAQVAPKYHFSGCTLAGQDFHDEAGKFSIHAAAGTSLYSKRLLTDKKPRGYQDVWNIHGAPLTGKHFTLSQGSADLHQEHHTLLWLSGQINQAAANCPLPPGSKVEWQHSEPQVLGVYGAAGVSQCGDMRIRPLTQPPQL